MKVHTCAIYRKKVTGKEGKGPEKSHFFSPSNSFYSQPLADLYKRREKAQRQDSSSLCDWKHAPNPTGSWRTWLQVALGLFCRRFFFWWSFSLKSVTHPFSSRHDEVPCREQDPKVSCSASWIVQFNLENCLSCTGAQLEPRH